MITAAAAAVEAATVAAAATRVQTRVIPDVADRATGRSK